MPRHLLETVIAQHPPQQLSSITSSPKSSPSKSQSQPQKAVTSSKNNSQYKSQNVPHASKSVKSTDAQHKKTEKTAPQAKGIQNMNNTVLVMPVTRFKNSKGSLNKSRTVMGVDQVKNWSGDNEQSERAVGHINNIPIDVLIGIGVCCILLIIIVCICIAYKKYRARKDYNQNPQLFAHKPDLSGGEEDNLQQTQLKKLFNPQGSHILTEQQVKGKLYRIEFVVGQPTGIYFDRVIQTTCYFEMEVLALTGEVEIGYLLEDSLEKVQKRAEGMSNCGVAVSNTGLVQSQGESVFNYNWSLNYGDVIGIGITKEGSNFSERRAWISKNGMLLNTPPEDQMDKWLATIQINAKDREQYDMGKNKIAQEDQQIDQQDQQKVKQRQARMRQQAMLKKQRISMKTFNPYRLYPAIICHGVKSNKPTIINVNVGGQIFRMNEATFRSGLLKNKSFFAND